MEPSESVSLIRPQERMVADPTPGVTREQAVAVEGLWSGLAITQARTSSGWHHHGEHETSIYVVDGALLLEFGPGGERAVEAGPGDFVHVPKHVVHRESNPADQESHLVVTRSGHGPVTVNVDGPPPGGS
ncbi:MAG TPA: cupin domain-containing protein [Nocardioidaceae bacterium]|nr:cupin domain-containing protein [Nocardioidaceae bacterium]